jgi:signal transduction histidine kinase
MQERAQLVGGTLKVMSRKGKGTTIVIEAPG